MKTHQLPLGWRRLAIGELVTDRGLFVDGDWVESKDQDPNGEIRLIQLADIKDGYFESNSSKHLTDDKAKELRCTPLKMGDILVARMPDPLGRACIFPGSSQECITAVDVCILRPNNPLINIAWLKYAINSPETRKQIIRLSRGTTRNRISRKDFSKIQLSVPPLDTQRKIVAILEKAEATQRLRTEADALMQDLLQSIFLEMFGDPSIKSTNWPYERLGNVIGVTSGHGFKLEEYSDDGIRLLRINNVSFGDIIWEQVAYLPFEYGDKFPHLVLKKDDILMALNRPILGNKLKVGMMDEEDAPAILYQRVGRIDILDEERVNRLYLFHLLRTRYFLSELSARLSGSDQPYINPTAMVKIKIPLPPIAIQKRFAQIAANIQLTYDTGQSSRNQLQTLFQVIIDRAFTGDLIP